MAARAAAAVVLAAAFVATPILLLVQNKSLREMIAALQAVPPPNSIQPIRKRKILLVRHGQSEPNLGSNTSGSRPDHALRLTRQGRGMAEAAGVAIRKTLEMDADFKDSPTKSIQMWLSPYQQTRETAVGILHGLGDLKGHVTVRESTLLADQDWGLLEGIDADSTEFTKELARMKRMKDHNVRQDNLTKVALI
eukprot:c14615_g1_i3.p1 GENE.c14615_g1_i3~~c14615_g1_i3.p1  ORF type:complete len:194 (-),score=36.97 c14615_g1_i3:21-602(-)